MQLDLARPLELIFALLPEVLLCVAAVTLALYAAWKPESLGHQRRVGWLAVAASLVVLGSVVAVAASGLQAGRGPIAIDGLRWTADIVLLVATATATAISLDYNEREGIVTAESHVLVLFATLGMMLMAAARDLMVLFLGLETMSIAVYVLAGLDRRSPRSAEAAVKYLLLGAFSTAFFLYGIALVYGATGTTNIQVIGARIVELVIGDSPMLLIGVALLLVGFAFKIAAAPFHMWAPDVYEGAPTPITGYMAAAVKAAAFTAFLRVWFEAFSELHLRWHDAIWWLSAVTMVVGNTVALQQKNIKRMLAYSSIAHTGFILVALAAGTPQAMQAFLFYALAYTFATMGAFAVVSALASPGSPRELISDYEGLWLERPWLAGAMSVFMLALLGFPVFGGMGFFAKWYVLQAALDAPAPQIRLAVLLVLTTVVSAGYYLHIVVAMFMRPRRSGSPALPPIGLASRAVIAVSLAAILFYGVFPESVVRFARSAVAPALRAAVSVVQQQ
jgi:NADH-quinone oxidoreductase subunit N